MPRSKEYNNSKLVRIVRSSVAVKFVRDGRFPPMGWHIGTAPTDEFEVSLLAVGTVRSVSFRAHTVTPLRR